jgi:tetratricopeptide (TPR) repeat protein
MRATSNLARIHFFWLLCAILPASSFGQTKAIAESARSTSSVVRIGIRDFRKADGDKRLDVLEETLPYLLRAGLFSEKRFEVTLLGKAGSDSAQSSASRQLSSSSGALDLVVEGEILQVTEDRLRVSISASDVSSHIVVFRDSVDLDNQEIVSGVGQLADRMAGKLREKYLQAGGADRLVVVVGPFVKNVADPKFNFLDSSLPLSISGSSEKGDLRKKLVLRPVLPNQESSGSAAKWDILVTGKVSVVENSILISGTYQDRKGLTLSLEYKGLAAEPLKVVDNFSRMVWEVFAGRIAPAGGFRDEPVLFANPTFEKLYARGQDYQKAGDAEAALFLYGMALRKKPADVSARLRLAEVYRDREAYDQAEEQYAQLLAQNSRNPAAHLGLGVLYSKRGDAKRDDFRRALEQLNQASSLASSDPKLQSEICMRLGDVYLLMNQPEQGIQQFLQAANLDKTASAPYLSLGKAYRAKKDLDGAIASLGKGLALWPADKPLKNDLAAAFNELAKQQKDAKKFPESLATYQKTIDLDPPDTRLKAAAYLYSGIVIGWDLNDYPKGIIWLRKATEFEPGNEMNWRSLGMALQRNRKYKEAIENLTKAISVSPVYESYWELALTYRLNGQYDLGIASMKKGIELDAKNTDGFTLLGALYESKFSESHDDKESFGLSVENLKHASELDPKNEAPLRILGIIYREGRDPENSVATLKQAIAVKPTVWSWDSLCSAYWELKKADDAINACNEALKLDRRYDSSYTTLEDIYSKTNQYPKFVQLLTDTTQADPKFVFPFVKLAILANTRGKYEDAVALLGKALAAEPDSEWANRVMGVVYTNIGERDKSKAAYETAIKYVTAAVRSDPKERQSYTQFGNIYSDLGEDQKAIENFRKSIDLDPLFTTPYAKLETLYDKQKGGGAEFNLLLESVVARKPDFAWARVKLADRYFAIRRYDDAVAQASRAVELKTTDPRAFYLLAQSQWLKPEKELAKATENARKAVQLQPKNSDYLWTLAYLLFEQNQAAQAVQEFELLAKQNPDSSITLALLANAYDLQKSFPLAHQYAAKAAELSPKYPYPLWVIGRIYADEKKFAESAASAKQALNLFADYRDAQILFYTSSHLAGQDRESIQFLEQLLAAHPDSRSLLDSIGFVSHEFLLDYQKAYEAHKKMYELNPQDWGAAENFAEANLTAGHYDAVLELTGKVLAAVPEDAVQAKLSMKLLQIAAYLLRGEQGRAFAELGVFRDDYAKVPKDYARSWTYEGTKNYVKLNTALKPAEKSLLINMIDLLESPPARAAENLKKFNASFAETFTDMKAVAAAGKSQ